MKLAILGTRGIPNHYGGFEQLAEYLALELVKRGHAVSVYNSSRHPYQQNNFEGVELVHCYDPEDKLGTFGQFVYDLNCMLHVRKTNVDVILQLGYTSSSVWYWLYPKRAVTICNMDGLEWKRSKYGKLVRGFLRYAEKLAVKHHQYLVSDSLGIQNYLQKKYEKESNFIAYGAAIFPAGNSTLQPDENILKPFSLRPHAYYLMVCRFEQENHVEMIIKGYLLSHQKFPLILIGASKNKYSRYLKEAYKTEKIRFMDGLFDLNLLNHLRYFSKLYFHGHSVGGTNPSLLEAMASQAVICAHKNEFNEAILEHDAFYFESAADIAELLDEEIRTNLRTQYITANLKKIKTHYNWKLIVDAYETMMSKALKQ